MVVVRGYWFSMRRPWIITLVWRRDTQRNQSGCRDSQNMNYLKLRANPVNIEEWPFALSLRQYPARLAWDEYALAQARLPFGCLYRHGQRRFRPCNDQTSINLMRLVMQNYPSGTLHTAYALLEEAIIQWQNHSRLGLQHQATRMHRDSV